MSKGDKLLISDELLGYVLDESHSDETLGYVFRSLADYWASGGSDQPDHSRHPELADVMKIFCRQLDVFRKSVERGLTDADRREYNRRRRANQRASKRGEPIPWPDPWEGLSRVATATTATSATSATTATSATSATSATTATSATSATTATTATSATMCDSCDNPNQPNPIQTTTTTTSSHGDKVAAVVAGIEEGFEAFWTAYPKKQNRDQALAAWRNAQVFAGWPGAAAVVAAVEMMKRDPLWNREDGRFIPNPSTFLADRRWTDQPTLTPTAERAAAPAADTRVPYPVTNMPIRSLCRLLTTDKAFDRPDWKPGEKEALMARMKALGIEHLSDIEARWPDITVHEFITNTYKPTERHYGPQTA